MEDSDDFNRLSKVMTGGSQRSCEGCKVLNCHSIHGPVIRPCLVKDCYFCADLALTDNEISAAYQHLLDLVQKRAQTMKKTHHDTYIHRLPVEILSLIFISLKEALVKENEEWGFDFNVPWFKVPPQSPHLLVGAVCKRWREVTLAMPTLWTDIVVDIAEFPDTQLRIINDWAHRAGTLPLNLTIFLKERRRSVDEVMEDCEDVVKTLRSLALRWNSLVLRAPWLYCCKLLKELEETPTIRSLSVVPMTSDIFKELRSLQLQQPLCPQNLYWSSIIGFPIPLGWDNLQHLEVDGVSLGQLLHVLNHAQNLRHCATQEVYDNRSMQDLVYPIPTTQITNNSLIHLEASDNVLQHVTLPSLQHLHYSESRLQIPVGGINPFVSFISRASPPLRASTFTCRIWPVEFIPCLEKLVDVTQLSIKLTIYDPDNHYRGLEYFLRALTDPSSHVVLPCLKELTLEIPIVLSFVWVLVGRLFQVDDVRSHGPDIMPTVSVTFGRPLAKVHITVWEFADENMDKDTRLHFLAVQKSGVDLCIRKSLFYEDENWVGYYEEEIVDLLGVNL